MRVNYYSVEEIDQTLRFLSRIYDAVRLVDADNCRVLEIGENHKVFASEVCYHVWNRNCRCENCSSHSSCRNEACQRKVEPFEGKNFHVTSLPVHLKQEGNLVKTCTIEMIRIADRKGMVRIKTDAMTALKEGPRLLGLEVFCEQAQAFINSHGADCVIISASIRKSSLPQISLESQNYERLCESIGAMFLEAWHEKGIVGQFDDEQFVVCLERADYSRKELEKMAKTMQMIAANPDQELLLQFGTYEVHDVTLPVPVMIVYSRMAQQIIRDNPRQYVAGFQEVVLRNRRYEEHLIRQFHKGLQHKKLQMYLQPQITGDRKLVGAEALSRWVEEDGSVIYPASFIHILEQSDLITELDLCIWEQAVRKLAEWKNDPQYADLYLSVNISPRDFRHINVAEVLTDLCDRYGVERARLHTEIVETAREEDFYCQADDARDLKNHAFTVEFDDFGKGTASFRMLKDFDADVLKVDMSFLHESRNHGRTYKILNSLINMAEDLDMAVVVEGVETEEQAQALSKMGCDILQGYLFSRPIPVREFEDKYRSAYVIKQEDAVFG